jgi:hypothetical protein
MTKGAEDYAKVRDQLLARRPLPPLAPGAPFDRKLTSIIDGLHVAPEAKACLHLLNDDLTRSHEIAQTQEGVSTFDYIHAIVHRREGDFSNSKYWFRQVGTHPLWTEIYGSDPGAPARFVDHCREAGNGASPELEEVQLRELSALLQHVSRAAAV